MYDMTYRALKEPLHLQMELFEANYILNQIEYFLQSVIKLKQYVFQIFQRTQSSYTPADFILLINLQFFYMKSLLFIVAFIVGASAVFNYSYTFPYEPTQNPLNGVFNAFYSPSYSLGALSSGRSLNIKATLPNMNTQDLAGLTITLYQRTSSSPLAFSQVSLQTVKTNATYLQYSYAITSSATYQLRAICSSLIDFNYFYLQVVYYTTGQSSSSPSARSLLKVTESQRNAVYKLIYVASPTNLAFSFFPALSTGNNINLKVNPVDSNDLYRNNGFRLQNQIKLTNEFNDVTKVQTFNSFATIDPGYYLVQVAYTPSIGQTSKMNLRMIFQTDSYKCPYNAQFSDMYQNFQGCSRKAAAIERHSGGLPCTAFNEISGLCYQCTVGYDLINYACVANTNCPDRQYFHFGQCLNVSQACGAYDHFTGSCMNCSDTINYNLVSGQCVSKVTVCGSRQWKANSTCFNVSSSCDTFDINTGFCLTCIGNSTQLNADGICTSFLVNCSQRQYVSGLTCVPIPAECLQFDSTLERCMVCIEGYKLQDYVCHRMICPKGSVPSRHRDECITVSQLCASYDNISGDCLSCKASNYVAKNGSCLQITPLAGCQERQKLGFGECLDVKKNCKIYNLASGNCQQCVQNYYIEYTGHCVSNVNCDKRHLSSNGRCLKFPQNCQAVDNIGLCIHCSENYILETGICKYRRTCESHQYLSHQDQCVDISLNCATWNPSNGKCIACLDSSVYPTQGVCCKNGEFYSEKRNICLDRSQQKNQQNPCLITHHSLGVCLKCEKGYTPDSSSPYGCFKT